MNSSSSASAPISQNRAPQDKDDPAAGAIVDFSPLCALFEEAVNDQVFPGAVLLVGWRGQRAFLRSFGFKSREDTEQPGLMAVDTVFDVASLTNIVVTTTLIMKLLEAGKLKLEDKVSRYLHNFSVHGKSPITIEHLLSHRSGLAHWHPFYEDLLRENAGTRRGILTSGGAKQYVYTAINRSQLKYAPGTRQVYSDLGFIVLGHIIEILTGLSLERAAQRYIFHPLGLKSTSYIDLTMIRRRGIHPVRDLIAPTEACPWRRRVLCGEVHDDNAWAMGGIAGHSGLFSSAGDLHVFATEMMRAYYGQSEFVSRDIVRRFWRLPVPFDGVGWHLGWDSPSKENGFDDSQLGASAVGHNGFTGCSLWIEPQKGIDIVLLSNRIHPSRSNKRIRALRLKATNAVLDAFREAPALADS